MTFIKGQAVLLYGAPKDSGKCLLRGHDMHGWWIMHDGYIIRDWADYERMTGISEGNYVRNRVRELAKKMGLT